VLQTISSELYRKIKQGNGNSEKKIEKEELTSTVKKRRSSNFAKRRKS
jgi:hypothetical protein